MFIAHTDAILNLEDSTSQRWVVEINKNNEKLI
ncbi:hypothetical protein NIES2107_55140 [Nostoc carneum NIES-2107]|nr:hypothetical protein NIES2107_55140 [Nostoc carneum NIES-2107]